MLTYHEGLDILRSIDFQLPTESVALVNTLYRILREEIVSDINIPPFDKSAMDGFACRKEDLGGPLKVIGTIFAGSIEQITVMPGTCVRIMTGAPVPEGADIVIMKEHTQSVDEQYVRFTGNTSKTNICQLGEDVRSGDSLLDTGTLILPQHIAILASAGYDMVEVSLLPRVAILSTGNELVEPGHKPGNSQIRNSNAYNLTGQLKSMGISPYYMGILPDSKEIISKELTTLLKNYDIIIISGGASQGEHDYIPVILKELNLKSEFNQLAIQPGKPVSFASGKDRFCFGLSGNPVSSFLQFELLVKPFIFHIMKHSFQHPIIMSELAVRIRRKQAERLKFFPVCFNDHGRVEEIRFNGSAHIAGLSSADGFGLFPKDCEGLEPGDKIEVLLIR